LSNNVDPLTNQTTTKIIAITKIILAAGSLISKAPKTVWTNQMIAIATNKSIKRFMFSLLSHVKIANNKTPITTTINPAPI